MKTSRILFASMLAAVTISSAFANPSTPAVTPLSTYTNEPQVAQASAGVRTIAPTYRAGSNAVSSACANNYNEATSMVVCANPDSRTRAQVREETRQWLKSPEGRAAQLQMRGAF